jgi:hypothetical protein
MFAAAPRFVGAYIIYADLRVIAPFEVIPLGAEALQVIHNVARGPGQYVARRYNSAALTPKGLNELTEMICR